MATISLKVAMDKSQAVKGFDELARSPEKFSKAVKKSATDSKKALSDLAKTAPKIPPIIPPVSAKEVNVLRALKKEIRDLQGAAIKAGEGTKEYARLLDLAASKSAELRDLGDAVKSLDPDVKAAAFTNLASTAVGAGQGIAGAFALAGIEGEDYQKLLVRLQGIEAIGAGIKSLGQLKDEWGKVKIALNSYLLKLEAKIVTEQVGAVVTAETAVAQEAATVAAIQNTEAITAQTLAQRALALAQAATPWGAIAIAVGAVAAVIAVYVANSQAAAAAEKMRNTAADGTVFANQELRDSYNELLKMQRDYRVDLQVMSGALSKYDGELLKIVDTYNSKLIDAQTEYNAKLEEQDVWYNNILPAQKLYNDLSTKASASKELETAQTQALIDKLKEEEALRQSVAKTIEQSNIALGIEILNTQKALLEAGGKQTFEIQKDIANKEAELARISARDAEDSANQLAIVEEQLKQKIIRIDQEQADEQVKISKEAADAKLRIQEDLFSKLSALAKQVNANDDQNLSPEVKAKKTLEANLAAIDALGRESALKQKNLSAEQQIELEESLRYLVDESYRNYYEELTILRQKQIAADIAADKAMFDARLERLNNSQQIELNDIELWTRESGESEEGFIKRKEEAKTALQLQFAQARLAILQEEGLAGNEVEISNLQVLINSLKSEVEKSAEANAQTGKKFLAKLLGVDEAGLESIVSQFKDVFLPAVSDFFDKQLQAQEDALNRKKELNDAELDENQRRIDELKSQLDKELAEQRLGRANNVLDVQNAIALEQKAREKNLQDQKAIQAEQARLARLKRIQDSAEQASSIISAVANIIKGWSTVPLIGSVLGLAAAGLMLGSFVALKAKAGAATAPGFRTGTKNAPAGMKWVGEDGPELINDKGGYAIMNNPDSMRLMEKYNMPAMYKPNMDFDVSRNIVHAAQDGRSAQFVNVDSKGTEKRLDEIIEQGKKSVVRSVTRKRSA